MSLSNHAETLLLNWLLTAGTATRPTAWHVAAGTASGDTFTELASSNGYARAAVTLSVTANVATLGACSLGPATGGNWAEATHIAIYDASSGGNLLAIGLLATPRTVTSGNVLDITGAANTITLAGNIADGYRTTAAKWLFTTDSVTRPTAWWLALGTAATTAGITEEASAGYARESIAMGVSGDAAQNSGLVVLGPAAADWDDVTHGAIMDASSSGAAIVIGALTGAPLDVPTGIVARAGVGAVRVTQT